MGHHELAKVIPALRDYWYFSNADKLDPAMVAALPLPGCHWLPGDVFERLSPEALWDNNVKVYLGEAAAMADLSRAWTEVAAT
jgi:hypothetical protein